MKFKDKLEKFKTERVGFHVDTKEIADELQKVFDKEKLESYEGVMDEAWGDYGNKRDFYISYNYYSGPKLAYGICGSRYDTLDEIMPITLEELKEYNGITPVTITITSDGYHRVTAESNGVTAEALCNPTDTFDVAEGAKLAIQRLLREVKEVPKFSVGDTVEVINAGPNNTPMESKGMRGKVTKVFPSGLIDVNFGNPIKGPGQISSSFRYYPQDIKLVPKDEPMFHKGDLVEVIGDCMFTKGAIGLQGVVMENNDAPFVTLVTRVNHSDCWSFKQENLKLIRRANV